jgi:hypothetical protein
MGKIIYFGMARWPIYDEFNVPHLEFTRRDLSVNYPRSHIELVIARDDAEVNLLLNEISALSWQLVSEMYIEPERIYRWTFTHDHSMPY